MYRCTLWNFLLASRRFLGAKWVLQDGTLQTEEGSDVQKKNRRVPLAIDKVDVVDLVSRAWEVSFARVKSNKKAIADRGWSPLNYNCLLHPEIQATQYKNPSLVSLSQITDVVPPDGLNLTVGLAATIMDSLTEAKMRADARNGIDQEEHRRQKSEKAKKAIQDSKRITAGVHFIAGNTCIGLDVLQSLEGSQQRKNEIESEKHRKLMVQYHTLRNKVVAIRELNVETHELSKQQLQDMVKWYRNDNDGAIPTTKQGLVTRYLAVRDRGEPQPPPAFAPLDDP
jgi:hypothetical protein